jgi:hypothetical protein
VVAENCILGSFTRSTDYRIFLEQIRDDELDGSCTMYVRDQNCLQSLGGKA